VRPCEGLGWSGGLHLGIVAPEFRCFFARTRDDNEECPFPRLVRKPGKRRADCRYTLLK
jgi:hypothetical protein